MDTVDTAAQALLLEPTFKGLPAGMVPAYLPHHTRPMLNSSRLPLTPYPPSLSPPPPYNQPCTMSRSRICYSATSTATTCGSRA
jgi:hypothetical protein